MINQDASNAVLTIIWMGIEDATLILQAAIFIKNSPTVSNALPISCSLKKGAYQLIHHV